MRLDDRLVNITVLGRTDVASFLRDHRRSTNMLHEVAKIIYDGPEQARKITGLQLTNGQQLSAATVIAMIERHGETFIRKIGNRWDEVKLIHKKVWITELDA